MPWVLCFKKWRSRKINYDSCLFDDFCMGVK